MLTLRDFTHLPLLDDLLSEIVQSRRGLIVVAGWGAAGKAQSNGAAGLLPSGRSALHGIVLNEFLQARPQSRIVQVTSETSEPRRPKTPFGRMMTSHVTISRPYPMLLQAAASTRPDLIVLNALLPENSLAALAAAEDTPVLAQLDSVLRGREVDWLLSQYAGQAAAQECPLWVISVMRQRGLCPHCSVPDREAGHRLLQLQEHGSFPQSLNDLDPLEPGNFRAPAGCGRCQSTGRSGEITIFDVYQRFKDAKGELQFRSRISREEYMLGLAAQGQLPLVDMLSLEAAQKHQLQSLLAAQEAQIIDTQNDLRRRLVELEASNLVLQRRTEQLISLENISQTLIGTGDLHDLAYQVCRHLETLFGADFVVLYSLASMPDSEPIELEILAVNGWRGELGGRRFPCHELTGEHSSGLRPFPSLPPGLSALDAQQSGLALSGGIKSGLWIPLSTQEGLAGLMVVQSAGKTGFSPGEKALLRTFANQTALALQRARLQNARIEKEKLERELEVARQLQQSLLPSSFPQLPGLDITAASRSARRVGGDFYDLFQIDAEHIGLVIGDASDKGIPAALYMALTRSLILAEAQRSLSSEQVLRRVNEHLLGMGQLRGFITVFFGILALESRLLRYSRAGHDRPVLLRDSQAQRLSGGGMPLGIFPDGELELSELTVQLQNGDRLVLYTDGVMDVFDARGNLLPQSEFDRLLGDYLPQQAGCTRLLEHLQRLAGGEQFDDMTLLCLSVSE